MTSAVRIYGTIFLAYTDVSGAIPCIATRLFRITGKAAGARAYGISARFCTSIYGSPSSPCRSASGV